MHCPHCETYNVDSARFCANCGRPLVPAPSDGSPLDRTALESTIDRSTLDPAAPDPAALESTIDRSTLGAASSPSFTGPSFSDPSFENPAPPSDPTPGGTSRSAATGGASSSTGNALFDQDAVSTTNRGALIAVAIVVVAVLTVAGIFITTSRSDSDTTTPSLPTVSSVGDDAAATSNPVTLPPATLPPATTTPTTTTPATTTPPTTAPATTTPATTTPPTTSPATTTPATTAAPAPPTTAPPLWAVPTIPPPPLPTSGPGSPLIAAEVFPGGVRAVDAQPFFLRVQALADALAAGNYGEARSIQLESLGDDSAYAARYGQLDRSSLLLVDAGVAGGSYELLTIEMNLEESASFTRVLCTQFVADGAQGRVTRRGGFELERWPENITSEQLRNNAALFDGLRTRCTFGSVRPSLES
ncbi:MAG: zinc ribbon domain-containing protein [Ilumatobacter sp.]|uniref:zinc ribbon domain-containing protein n=1 Tax=Ilumatobacter sp. TaxID=1967498 RepID=UPI00391ADC54